MSHIVFSYVKRNKKFEEEEEDFFDLFFGPHVSGIQWFHELFRFRKDIRLQSSKIACPRSQRLRGHAI